VGVSFEALYRRPWL